MDGTRVAHGDGLLESIRRVVVWRRHVGTFLIGQSTVSGI